MISCHNDNGDIVRVTRQLVLLVSKQLKTSCITARDGHAFHKRVINIWNALPECVVSANSISSFKCKAACLFPCRRLLFVLQHVYKFFLYVSLCT